MGLKTLILEKESLPRYKSCGSGVTLTALELLDFPLSDSLIEGECSAIQLRYGLHSVNIVRPYRLGIFTSRAKFDAFLTTKAVEAGAEIYEGRRVTSVEVFEKHAVVRCGSDSYFTKLVIGADGAYSIVAKNVRLPFRRHQIAVACDVSLRVDELKIEHENTAVFEFGLVKYGYAWIFPRKEYLGVGIVGMANKLQSHKETLRSVLLSWGIKRTDIEAHWHVLPLGGFRHKIYADRIMLVGDAAAFVEPFFDEGISLAIRSATYAAETARIALDRGNCTEAVLKIYEESCEIGFGKFLQRRLKLASILYGYPNILIKPFVISAKISEIFWKYSSAYLGWY